MDYVPDQSEVDTSHIVVDADTKEMLNEMGINSSAVQLSSAPMGGGGGGGGRRWNN